MAVELANAYVSVVMEASGLSRQLNSEIAKTGPAADRAGKDAGKRFSGGMGAAFKGIGGLFAGAMAGLAVGDFLKDSLTEARESQKVGALTASIIKSTGGAAKITADQVGSLAGAISQKTGVDDEAIQSGANLLLTFKNVRNEAGKGNDVFNQATAAALDLSKAGFGSVEGASKMMGKALNDPVKGITALGRAGVTFSEDQKTAIKQMVKTGDVLGAQKIILGEVQSQVGGAAEATATAGDKARVTFDNLKESAGTYLLPIIDNLATKFTELVAQFQSGTGTGGQIRSVFEALGTAAGFLGDHMTAVKVVLGTVVAGMLAWKAAVAAKNVVDAIQLTLLKAQTVGTLQHAIVSKTVSVATKVWAAGQWLLNAALTANPIGLVIAAIAGLIALIVLAYKKNETFRNIVNAVWAGIKAAVLAVVDWFRNTAWPWIKNFIDANVRQFEILKTRITGAWDAIKAGLKAGWDWIVRNVFDPFKRGLGLLGTAFGTVRDAIGTAWDGIKAKAKAPIKFVIDTVLNKGLIAGFNWISGKIGGPHVDPIKMPAGFAKGGVWQDVLPGYTPGRDVHRFVSPTGGVLDLSGGEGILIPQITKALGGAAGIAALNRGDFSALGQHAYAGGGVLDWLFDKASSVYKAVTHPLDYLKSKLPKMPGGFLGELAGGVKDKIVGTAVSKIKALWEGFGGGGTGIGSKAYGWKELWAIVHKILPGIQLTSAYRPGAITALGNKSLHSMGRAIDVAPPSMAAFNKILAAFPNATQLFYGPADGRTLLNGRPWRMDAVTKRNHFDHIHLAMANGGIFRPPVFDSGGTLRPGLNVVDNRTGAPESLVPAGQSGTVVYMTVAIDDLAKLNKLDDFLAMLDRERVNQLREQRSGKVSA